MSNPISRYSPVDTKSLSKLFVIERLLQWGGFLKLISNFCRNLHENIQLFLMQIRADLSSNKTMNNPKIQKSKENSVRIDTNGRCTTSTTMAATADCRQTRENQTSCRRSTDSFSLKDSLILSLLLSALFVATINIIQIDATTIECGTVNLYREAILKGEGVIKDEWPFIVALYYSRKSTFFCGGTIISQKHILTAAHCVQRKGTIVPLSPDEIIVRLGAYNLTDRGEKDAINRNVTAIHVHPDWKFNDERYDADLAILVLNENITYSNHIRPICMPPGKYLIDGLDGTVVGWGTTENRTAEGIPRKIKINALNDTYCYETDKDVGRYASERSFCGEGSGAPSTGDSGGGFFAVAGSGWVQFGTVSFVRPKGSGRDLTIAVYMKLTMLRDWIAATVKKSGGTISVATTKADLNCTYMYTDQAVYGCRLFDLNIRQENFVVENFTGPHLIYHGNEEVAEIVFESGVMASFPRGTGTIFKNLQSVVITANTRRMYLSRYEESDPAKRILFLELERNSLWDLSNLQSFDVTETHLKSLDAATFSKNCKLTSVKVRWCTLKSLPWNLLRNNLLLEHVSFDYNSIEFVDENAFETNVNLRAVSLKRNRLRHLSRNLFLNNADMQSIDLSNNLIRTIAEQTLAANSKLVSVNLASNKLEVLPKCLLQNLTFLKNFYANDNLLSEVDAQFFETNVAIEEIHLQSNHLTHIPATLFRNNSKLRNIQLGSNAIETIDGNLFEGNLLLHNVSLKSNLLISLPPNLFTNNVEIQFLNLGENLLETVDERTLETNARLLQVSFKDNFLTFLPEKLFRNNSLLQYVWFDKNFLVTLDENIFQANPVLFKVSFASNLLDHLPENLFRNNSRLLVVDFSQNFFTTLSENIFRHNPKLIKVSMREGSLQSLPRNLFRNNSRLQFIDLVANYLQFIETDFTMLKRLSIVNLNRNQCINIVYYDSTRALFRIDKAARRIENLTEFQDYVTTNCS